jgi:hypothetical protein
LTRREDALSLIDTKLQELERSELFSPAFPRRQRLTHEEWAALSAEERSKTLSPKLTAVRRIKNSGTLVDIVKLMGTAKYEPAVPVLSRLWKDCALMPVRYAAGHALRAIGSTHARAALAEQLEDSDDLSVFLAVRAVFDADPAAAFDQFSCYFDLRRVLRPGGRVIPEEVLRTFGREWKPHEKIGGHWIMGAPHWFAADPRWMELCLRLRLDPQLGRAAREVLRLADPERVKEMLSQAREKEQPRTIRWRSTASGDLVTRYCRGEHEAAWKELRADEAIDGDRRAEALAVATETMRRVARCADVLAERLSAGRWVGLTGRFRWPPRPENSTIIRDIEQFTGAPLPPSLRAFWDIVGGIDFVWDYKTGRRSPDFGTGVDMAQMDPLCVDACEHVTYLLEEWDDRRSRVDPELNDPWDLDLAPDYLHKAKISGGAPYGIELPFLGADPIFAEEEHVLPFVDYLRLAFRWGGFPRLERHAHDARVRTFVAEMTKGLEPF